MSDLHRGLAAWLINDQATANYTEVSGMLIAPSGDSDEYVRNSTLEHRNSYALTGYPRLRVTPAWHVHVGGQVNRGGETCINVTGQRNLAGKLAGDGWHELVSARPAASHSALRLRNVYRQRLRHWPRDAAELSAGLLMRDFLIRTLQRNAEKCTQ